MVIQPLPAKGFKKVRSAKKVLDRICSQLTSERKTAMLREQQYGVKEKSDASGRDLLTLMLRANLQESDGMNDSDVRARKGSRLKFSATPHIYTPCRDRHLPHRRPRDDEHGDVVDLVRALPKSGGPEETQGGASGSSI